MADYYAEWTCNCGRKLRVFFKEETVRGPNFSTDHPVQCPDCKTEETLLLKPYRLDKNSEGQKWETV